MARYERSAQTYKYDSDPPEVVLSKKLSRLLRHTASSENIDIDEAGFVNVKDILKIPRFAKNTEKEIVSVVENNDKQRYSTRHDPETKLLQIRANQGHSMHVDPGLIEITDPTKYPKVIHGTLHKFYDRIRKEGLCRMKRNHIHMAVGEPGEAGVISGLRETCQVYIYVDIEAAMKDGYKFYESINKVVLCSGNEDGFLPTKYFKKVIDVRTGRELDFEL